MELMQYFRKSRAGEKNQKKGVMLAKKVKGKKKNGKVLVGWSLCKWNVDEFTELGVEIAENRIKSWEEKKRDKRKFPSSMKSAMKEFVKRCKRYFKTEEVKVV